MNIEITRWQPINHMKRGVATLNFRIGDIIVRGAMFERHKGGFRVVMPYLMHRLPNGSSVLAVGLPREKYRAVQEAAIEYYREHYGRTADRTRYERQNAGLHRVLSAEVEECERAGL